MKQKRDIPLTESPHWEEGGQLIEEEGGKFVMKTVSSLQVISSGMWVPAIVL